MRTFALLGVAALSIAAMTANASAWTAEQPSASGSNPLNYSGSEDPLKALEDKVNGKQTSETKSGFFISGGVSDGSTSRSGLFSSPGPAVDSTPYGYVPIPRYPAR